MQIDIHAPHLSLRPEQHERIVRRVRAALARLATRIRHVDVRLADVNGPRGGIDKRCRVLVHLDGGVPMLVEERGSDVAGLVDRAIRRAARAMRKRLGLMMHWRHEPQTIRRLASD